jgi:hypothetical protein
MKQKFNENGEKCDLEFLDENSFYVPCYRMENVKIFVNCLRGKIR